MEKYYLFLKDKKSLQEYKDEFNRVSEAINNGITPVYCEMHSAKTNLIETVPYNLLSGVFVVVGTVVLSKLNVNEVVAVGITFVINNVFSVIANYLFTIIKHKLKLKLCERLEIEPDEHNIATMESMEYQSV